MGHRFFFGWKFYLMKGFRHTLLRALNVTLAIVGLNLASLAQILINYNKENYYKH